MLGRPEFTFGPQRERGERRREDTWYTGVTTLADGIALTIEYDEDDRVRTIQFIET